MTRRKAVGLIGGMLILSLALFGCPGGASPLGGAGVPIGGLPGTGALCCTDFKVGADLSGADFGVDGSIKGQFATFAQASGDLSGAASAALDGVTGACRGMAQVGGAN